MNALNIKWINPYACDKFSEYKGIDLQELIVRIEDLYLVYRESLGIEENITFGFEIEFESYARDKVSTFINEHQLSGWECIKDGSLTNGGEVRTPIMTDNKKYWQELQLICRYLKKNNVDTCGNAGGHIHIGTPILGDNVFSWKNFLLIYANYEHVLFRFLYGDKVSHRTRIRDYAIPIRNKIIEIIYSHYYDRESIRNLISNDELVGKYHAVNFGNVNFYNLSRRETKNTIEFRAPNATIEEVIWQNNVNTLIKLLITSTSSSIDRDYLKHSLKRNVISEVHYNEICLEDVLNFVVLIFTTNIDKIYFLRQYFKSFENNFGLKNAVLAKNFIKK
jgi:hypothetical protein